MFCPRCKAEYRAGYTRCADCNLPLIDSLPVEKYDIDPDAKFIKILETDDITDIVLIKSTLNAGSIHYFIKGEVMKFIRPVDPAILMVAEEDAEKAVELLKRVKLNYFRLIFRNQR